MNLIPTLFSTSKNSLMQFFKTTSNLKTSEVSITKEAHITQHYYFSSLTSKGTRENKNNLKKDDSSFDRIVA